MIHQIWYEKWWNMQESPPNCFKIWLKLTENWIMGLLAHLQRQKSSKKHIFPDVGRAFWANFASPQGFPRIQKSLQNCPGGQELAQNSSFQHCFLAVLVFCCFGGRFRSIFSCFFRYLFDSFSYVCSLVFRTADPHDIWYFTVFWALFTFFMFLFFLEK